MLAKKLQLENEKLPQLQQQAQQSTNQMDIQQVACEQFIDRLDKRIYDLQLSRQIALQTAPQIRMIQNVNQALAEIKFNFDKYSTMEKSNGHCAYINETA